MMPLLFALTAALVTLALMLARTFDAEREARAQVLAETSRLFTLQQVLQTVTDAETGQRGYLLTGREPYLRPFREAQTQLEPRLRRLRGSPGEPLDARRLALTRELEQTVQAKMAELAQTVRLANAGRQAEAMAIVETDYGQREMRRLRGIVTAMVEQENRSRVAAFDRVMTIEQQVIVLAAVLGLAILALVVVGFRVERARAAGAVEVEQAAALREANARAQLLTRELNHRVKNLFSIILAIVSLSGRKQASVREVVEDIRARVRALSLAHTVSQGSVSDTEVLLGDIVARTLQPYDDVAGDRICINGPPQTLAVRAVTPVGLIVHELATNAVKYGALSRDEGQVMVNWEVQPDGNHAPQLHLSWIETGGPALSLPQTGPARMGYGSQMIALAANQLGGRIEKEWAEAGVIVRLTFPVPSSGPAEAGKAGATVDRARAD